MWRAIFGAAVALAAMMIAEDKAAVDSKEQLSKLQGLVGQWRGVGQPQRSSTKDSWIEEADWAWNFDKDAPSLVAKLPKGKYFGELQLSAGVGANNYKLKAIPAAGLEAVRYSGTLDDQNQLVFTADESREGYPLRLSFRFAAGGDRLLILLEKQGATSGQFARM